MDRFTSTNQTDRKKLKNQNFFINIIIFVFFFIIITCCASHFIGRQIRRKYNGQGSRNELSLTFSKASLCFMSEDVRDAHQLAARYLFWRAVCYWPLSLNIFFICYLLPRSLSLLSSCLVFLLFLLRQIPSLVASRPFRVVIRHLLLRLFVCLMSLSWFFFFLTDDGTNIITNSIQLLIKSAHENTHTHTQEELTRKWKSIF